MQKYNLSQSLELAKLKKMCQNADTDGSELMAEYVDLVNANIRTEKQFIADQMEMRSIAETGRFLNVVIHVVVHQHKRFIEKRDDMGVKMAEYDAAFKFQMKQLNGFVALHNGEELKSQGDALEKEKFAMVRSVDALDVDILELNNQIETRADVDESMESLNVMKHHKQFVLKAIDGMRSAIESLPNVLEEYRLQCERYDREIAEASIKFDDIHTL